MWWDTLYHFRDTPGCAPEMAPTILPERCLAL